MKILIELNATEMLQGMNNGTLKAFLEVTAKDEGVIKTGSDKALKEVDKVETTKPAFNPTINTPATTQAGFDPMAVKSTPAGNVDQHAPDLKTPPKAIEIQDVRAALAPAAKANKQTELAALFAEFGATKLTEIPPEHYEALIARAATL